MERDGERTMAKIYLGDGVYVEITEEQGIVLTTENGVASRTDGPFFRSIMSDDQDDILDEAVELSDEQLEWLMRRAYGPLTESVELDDSRLSRKTTRTTRYPRRSRDQMSSEKC